ncbi:hypothetical protein MTR_3g107703 [Medicago truncatula]|uniref:Uncharacterized protein n=1 Tax=Medicago truncatula TaxID=3880 RepID=A0A072V1P7_MEDTR|nr:hypothetical protein MTR_3g107703 [Medicago truncatula]
MEKFINGEDIDPEKKEDILTSRIRVRYSRTVDNYALPLGGTPFREFRVFVSRFISLTTNISTASSTTSFQSTGLIKLRY